MELALDYITNLLSLKAAEGKAFKTEFLGKVTKLYKLFTCRFYFLVTTDKGNFGSVFIHLDRGLIWLARNNCTEHCQDGCQAVKTCLKRNFSFLLFITNGQTFHQKIKTRDAPTNGTLFFFFYPTVFII